MKIERKNLRSQVREELLSRMRQGQVSPGESINEAQLATALGISRTPLREALIGLESEGQIQSENGKGFRFARLSLREFEELGPVLAALESLALDLTPPDLLAGIGAELEALSAADRLDAAGFARLDERWHETLTSGCANVHLRHLIRDHRGRFLRYESLLVAGPDVIERVEAEHVRLARHCREADLPAAKRELERVWSGEVARITALTSLPFMTP